MIRILIIVKVIKQSSLLLCLMSLSLSDWVQEGSQMCQIFISVEPSLLLPLFYSHLSDILFDCMSGIKVAQEALCSPNSSSVPLISSLCLSASLCPLVSSCFVPSVNKHRDICISGAVFSVDVCISNSLCGLTCFHQRR